MNPPPKILDAEITPSQLKVKLDSGITVLMPLDHSLHWESLDCDLSVEGLLAGAKEMPNLARKALEKFFARQYGRIAA